MTDKELNSSAQSNNSVPTGSTGSTGFPGRTADLELALASSKQPIENTGLPEQALIQGEALPEEVLNSLNALAAKISVLGLTLPALLMLEAHRPLAGLAANLILGLQPVGKLIGVGSQVSAVSDFLDDPKQINYLISILDKS